MSTPDFFRARLDQMIDLRHPLAVLATRMPWQQIEASVAPLLARKDRRGRSIEGADLFGPTVQVVGAGVSAAGRPRLAIRLMVSLLYLKHAYGLSDEAVVERWAENVVWQFFSGQEYYEPRLPCDATQIGRFRRVLGEAGVQELLAKTIEAAVQMQAVRKSELQRVIVDTTVQEKAVAYPTDSRLLEVARAKVVQLAQRAGLRLKQTFEREGRSLRRRAGGYAHAKQFKRLRRVLKRQRTVLGRVLRDVQRRLLEAPQDVRDRLQPWLERAERIRSQRPKDKHKLYALHAPEVECIGKGKPHKPYEFGVKVSVATPLNRCKGGQFVAHVQALPGNPYDGHTLATVIPDLEQSIGASLARIITDAGYRGHHAPKEKRFKVYVAGSKRGLTPALKRAFRRRAAVEPVIGHLKNEHRMGRNHLAHSTGDAINAVLAAVGYNFRRLLTWLALLCACMRMLLAPAPDRSPVHQIA